MNDASLYLAARKIWQEDFDDLLLWASEGVLKHELMEAKNVFFSKLGRAHEMKEDIYETASQSFLEWYLYDYKTTLFDKTPAVVFATLHPERSSLQRWLVEKWSLYEVEEMGVRSVHLRDLLTKISRSVVYDPESPECRAWKVEPGQIIQTRLFEIADSQEWFFTHLWLHPKTEKKILENLCHIRVEDWMRPTAFLQSCFESVVRSHGVQGQIQAANTHNWLYEDLKKRYAKAS